MRLRHSLLAAAALASLALAGCTVAANPSADQAYDECRSKVTPQLDDPSSAVWPDGGYSITDGETDRIVTVVIEEGSARTQVTCFVTATDDGWELSHFEFNEPKDEVVN